MDQSERLIVERDHYQPMSRATRHGLSFKKVRLLCASGTGKNTFYWEMVAMPFFFHCVAMTLKFSPKKYKKIVGYCFDVTTIYSNDLNVIAVWEFFWPSCLWK